MADEIRIDEGSLSQEETEKLKQAWADMSIGVSQGQTERRPPRVAFVGFAYNHRHAALRPWLYIEWLWQEAVAFVQRGWRGWADIDTWSLDWYLLRWIPSALRYLADVSHGHPGELTQEDWELRLEWLAEEIEWAHRAASHHTRWDSARWDALWAELGRWFFYLWD